MKTAAPKTFLGRLPPQELRRQIREGPGGDMARRRWIIGLSLFGLANMAYVSLFQTGMIKGLADPPLGPRFDSAAVNSSDTAYMYGVPDGTVDLAMLSLNVVLAAAGGVNRAAMLPLIPLALAGKASAEGAAAVWYFNTMRKSGSWCVYCILTALAHILILPLVLPEARRALSSLIPRR
ncbi:MAG: vitamin K epoxide reductase family protein [Elusimicrobiota bacterium]